jgi:lipoate-protein ligase A
MNYWRLLDLEYADPYINMAVEEAVSREVGIGEAVDTVRFWRNPNTIVIGRFQRPKAEIHFNSCRKYGTTFVRRFTGGGAVYQDKGNLNFSIFIRKKRFAGLTDINELFKHYSIGVIECFRNVGLNAEFKPINKIMIGERKVSGMAGSLRWKCLTVHGSILVRTNIEVLKAVLRIIKDPVTTLEDEVGGNVSISKIKGELKAWFERIYKTKLVHSKLTKNEKRSAEKLFFEKYSQKEWNYKSKML